MVKPLWARDPYFDPLVTSWQPAAVLQNYFVLLRNY